MNQRSICAISPAKMNETLTHKPGLNNKKKTHRHRHTPPRVYLEKSDASGAPLQPHFTPNMLTVLKFQKMNFVEVTWGFSLMCFITKTKFFQV